MRVCARALVCACVCLATWRKRVCIWSVFTGGSPRLRAAAPPPPPSPHAPCRRPSTASCVCLSACWHTAAGSPCVVRMQRSSTFLLAGGALPPGAAHGGGAPPGAPGVVRARQLLLAPAGARDGAQVLPARTPHNPRHIWRGNRYSRSISTCQDTCGRAHTLSRLLGAVCFLVACVSATVVKFF